MEAEEKVVTCPFCSVGCRYLLRVEDGRAVEVVPLRGDEVSKGRLCLRGWSAYGLSLSSRPSLPEVGERGRREAVSWEEAVEFVARRLEGVVREHGPQSVLILGSSLLPLEDIEAILSFASALGTPNADDPSRVERAALLGIGLPSLPPDLGRADLFVVVGSWLDLRSPILASDIMRSLKPVVAVGPVRDRMVRLSQVHLLTKPGGESATLSALLRAVGSILKGRGRVSAPFGAPSPGIPMERVEHVAGAICEARRPAVVVSLGLSLIGSSSVVQLARALAEAVGGELILSPAFSNSMGAEVAGLRPADGGMAVWEALGREPKRSPKAIILFGDDPLLRLPDVASCRAALEGAELVVVAHFCPTESARFSHAFLPLAGPLEMERTTVNFWGRRTESPAVLSPNGRRTAREILEEIAKRMGLSLGARWSPKPEGKPPKVEELPVPEPVSPTDERPFVLMLSPLYPWEGEPLALCALPNLEREYSVRARDFPEGYLSISSEDARRHRLRAWRRVKVASERGEAVLWLHISPEVPEGVAIVPFHLRGRVAEVLGEPQPDPLTGVPVLRPIPVSIEEAG